MRVDIFLSQKTGLSRNKISDLISQNRIKICGKIMQKQSFIIENPDEITQQDIEILGEIFVSRAALKLKGFLDEINFCVKNFDVLDIGCSTGGFLQILLLEGVKFATGVDVGKNQIDEKLKKFKNLEIFENTDIREFKSEKKFDLVTCDVSFIGVEKILEKIDNLAKKFIIILFKPQFEVGKNVKRNSKGVIKNDKAILLARKKFESEIVKIGWHLLETKASKICGKDGNIEFFYLFKKEN